MSQVHTFAADKCYPLSRGVTDCAAVRKEFPNIEVLYKQATTIVNGISEIGPLIANNPDCVKSSITFEYFQNTKLSEIHDTTNMTSE